MSFSPVIAPKQQPGDTLNTREAALLKMPHRNFAAISPPAPPIDIAPNQLSTSSSHGQKVQKELTVERLCPNTKYTPSWDVVKATKWLVLPEVLGGGAKYLDQFKDDWVRQHRSQIKEYAKKHKIPAELLAGIARIEVGGDLESFDRLGLEGRTILNKGPLWMKDLAAQPEKTSFGPLSMQLRTAADLLGVDVKSMSTTELRALGSCLERDSFSLEMAAKYLHKIAANKFPNTDTEKLTLEQVKIVGTCYNRGMGLSSAAIEKNTSNGRAVTRRWDHLTSLLQE